MVWAVLASNPRLTSPAVLGYADHMSSELRYPSCVPVATTLVSPDGTSERKLGALKTDYLLWARDGKTLYGVRVNQQHHQALFSLDVASGRQKDLEDLGSDFTLDGPWVPSIRFSLAPDGASFAMFIRKERSDLWMLENFDLQPELRGWLRK